MICVTFLGGKSPASRVQRRYQFVRTTHARAPADFLGIRNTSTFMARTPRRPKW